MKIIATDSKNVRTRVHVRAGSMKGDDLVVYGDVDSLPSDAQDVIRQVLVGQPVEEYPEGAYIGSFAPPDMASNTIRDPDTIKSDPYPRDIELSEFPPEERQLYRW